MGRWVFPRRLLLPIPAIVLAALLVNSERPYGNHNLTVTLASGLLVLAGLSLRIWAGGCAGNHTRQSEIEAPQLTTGGPYGYVRNPIYLGNMILGAGMIGLLGDLRLFFIYVPVFIILYVAIIPAEEEFLRSRYGDAYDAYCSAVPRIIPRLSPWRERTERAFYWGVFRGEAWIAFYLVVILAFFLGVQQVRAALQ